MDRDTDELLTASRVLRRVTDDVCRRITDRQLGEDFEALTEEELTRARALIDQCNPPLHALAA